MVKKYEQGLKKESPIQFKGFKEINFGGIIIKMKHLLLTTIAAVVVMGGGPNIHEATWTGNIEVIKQLIASDIDVNVKRNRGETPLHIAAIFSRYEIAKLLISKGADVNARNDDGFTPLHQAAYSFSTGPQKIRTIELLIAKGANVNSKGESGGTPLDLSLIHI